MHPIRSTAFAFPLFAAAMAAQAGGFSLTRKRRAAPSFLDPLGGRTTYVVGLGALKSPTIKPGSTLNDAQAFKGFGREGKNISPALKWSGAPKDTRSFALPVEDPTHPPDRAGGIGSSTTFPPVQPNSPGAPARPLAKACRPAAFRAGPTSVRRGSALLAPTKALAGG